MARRKEGGLDLIASMPWPFGFVLGIVAYVVIQQFGGMLKPLALIVLVGCWAAAIVSFLAGQKRKRLLDTQTGLESLAAMNWREFEMLVGEAFRRHGYGVEETGLGGADGGIDLILRKDGRTHLVQCKQWRTRQVKVPIVREMWGLVAHHQADGVKIVCVGEFTRDAEAFANGKAIELLNGEALLRLVRDVQPKAQTPRVESTLARAPEPEATVPTCPRCDTPMVLRPNRMTGQSFWGCSKFPQCRGSRDVSC